MFILTPLLKLTINVTINDVISSFSLRFNFGKSNWRTYRIKNIFIALKNIFAKFAIRSKIKFSFLFDKIQDAILSSNRKLYG